VHIKLLKRNVFSSRSCDGEGFSVATLRPETNLLLAAGEARDYEEQRQHSVADIALVDFSKSDLDNFRSNYGFVEGSSSEFSLQGLYGDYVLLFPAQVLAAGLDLRTLTDFNLRFDFLSVDSTPQINGTAPIVVPPDAAASSPPPICASSTPLESLVQCITSHMARSGSEGFVVPTAAQRADWRSVVTRMLQGSCDFALPSSLVPAMHLWSFVDSGNSKTYCVLMEVEDAQHDGAVDRGWGTVVVDPHATRELCQAAPHPLADLDTADEAIGVFKGTNSRIFALAGTHRDANAASSTCQSSTKVADAGHNTATMFHATTEALQTYYGSTPWVQIQWHGMAASSCASEVYITYGSSRAPNPSDSIVALSDNMRTAHSSWKLDIAGSGQCNLNATANVQGRLLNGVPEANVCTTSAST
jgi:hypothetical protein